MTSIERYIEHIKKLIRAGDTPEQAAQGMIEIGAPPEQVNLALQKYRQEAQDILAPHQPGTLDHDSVRPWYPGPGPDDKFWPAVRRQMLEKGWSPEVMENIDVQSSRVMARLEPPWSPEIQTRGLVLGYVQSGKTANFTAVVAKAADRDYRLFIVLSGLTNLLRAQTQIRLETDLVEPTREYWVTLTTEAEDFRAGHLGNVNAFLADRSNHKVICIVKKNAVVLRRLLRWLNGATDALLRNTPTLIIDDEADQASVNTAQAADERSTINRLILHLLAGLPRAAYVGYTATPFANVFIDPDPGDLYPKDFILSLPRPDGYFGPERLFGRDRLQPDEPEQDGLDMIRRVPEEEIAALQPDSMAGRHTFQPSMTPSLGDGLHYFWMATAARAARGDRNVHSTMLLHTTLYVVVHERLDEMVRHYRRQFLNRLRTGDSELQQRLREQWEAEQERVQSNAVGEPATSFVDLSPFLYGVVQDTSVVVENAQSDRRLDYSEPAIQIVIGGNVLSRGLTLEGLVVSYFIRTASAFDTLLQMGRWFGYRQGYADLPRIWMTAELERWFHDLATVEQEIRNDIRLYELENMTPLDFGIRIRTHPSLNITSASKMQAAIEAQISYSGQRPQTIFFKYRDWEWLQDNLEAGRQLVRQIQNQGIGRKAGRGETVIFREVPVDLILDFIDSYHFHDRSANLKSSLLRGYIEDQNRTGELRRWNVGVVGKQIDDDTELLQLGEGLTVPLLTRSRLDVGTEQYAYMGAIMSRLDIAADQEFEDELVRQADTPQLLAWRPDGIGLLLLYPIDKNSQPRAGSTQRLPLNAVEHILGLALVFPQTEELTPQTYMTVDLSDVVREELEWTEKETENDWRY